MALKVTALTYLPVLKDLSSGQQRLYNMFVEIAGYDLNAHITKPQVKAYIQNKFDLKVEDDEINDFFKVGKTDSADKNPETLSAMEYTMNIHAFPVHPLMKNALAAKIVNLSPKTVSELTDWMKRVTTILESIKRVDVILWLRN